MVQRRASLSQLHLTFFGLTSKHKKYIHIEILNLLTLSDGKISFSEAWELPVYLRKYYTSLYEEQREKEQKQVNSSPSNQQVSKPDIKSKPTPKYS